MQFKNTKFKDKDSSDFSVRGVMLIYQEARYPMDTLYHIIDILADLKINQPHYIEGFSLH